MMNDTVKHYCPTCGASMDGRWERLSPMLVEVLYRFHARVRAKGENCVSVSKEMDLTKTQYNNFQKLRFHGLVAKVKDPNGEYKSGYWLLTRRGNEFLQGVPVPRQVKIFRNRIVERSNDYVDVQKVLGERIFVDRITDFRYEPVEDVLSIIKPVQEELEW